MAEAGLRWWRSTTPHQRNGGSRCQDSPILSAPFCFRLRDAMIAESTCQQTLRAKRFARRSISSSAPACWKRSAPMARCWVGDAMLKPDPWPFASPSRVSTRLGSGTMRLALPRRQALPQPRMGSRPNHLPPNRPPPSGILPRHRGPGRRSISRARPRPRPAPRAKAGRARSKRACWRC
jgi:hypothetical protein